MLTEDPLPPERDDDHPSPTLSSGRPIPPVSNKRRSSWRYLLSPSYKSRSEEFHKLFADEIPKNERLIADYSCALHREILLQGRLYVSINYLAFYSNIFSWITRLVVRMSDIRDIHKANTAKIIPNAIQIITEQGDKHVFASFIARDKSYIMIWRIWRNSNLIKERLSDQEIRRLVHMSYGKDLGLNDLEEQKISGEPMASPSCSPIEGSPADDNNNSNNNNSAHHLHHQAQFQQTKQQKPVGKLRFKSRSQSQKEVLSLIEEGQSGDDGGVPRKTTTARPSAKAHKRNKSFDLGRTISLAVPTVLATTTTTTDGTTATNTTTANTTTQKRPTERGAKKKAPKKRKQSDRVVRHLSMRLANLSSLSYHDDDDDDEDDDVYDDLVNENNENKSANVSETKSGEEGEATASEQVPRAANGNDRSPTTPSTYQRLLNETGSSTSSAVIVDTPLLLSATSGACHQANESAEQIDLDGSPLQHKRQASECNESSSAPTTDPAHTLEREQTLAAPSAGDDCATSMLGKQQAEEAGACPIESNGSLTATQTANGLELSTNSEPTVVGVPPIEAAVEAAAASQPPNEQTTASEREGMSEEMPAATMEPLPADEEETTECGCGEHQGVPIADEPFDIGVDILFSLIFTNSKFMRAHMIRRGATSASVSKWRRNGGGPGASGSGDRSNSSTLSRDSQSSQLQLQQQQDARKNSLDSLRQLNQQVGKVKSEQERQLSYSMNVNHVLAKQIKVEERQNIRMAKPGLVYVLKSQTINSGFPCSESFTVDLTYCLTRYGSPERSRMLVHGLINFIKEKHSWRLSMIKSVIEKSSMEGIKDFIGALTEGIRSYVISKRKATNTLTGAILDTTPASARNDDGGDDSRDDDDDNDDDLNDNNYNGDYDTTDHDRTRNIYDAADQDDRAGQDDRALTPTGEPPRGARGSRSLARVKSKLKERKLRTMYKYYIQTAQLDLDDEQTTSLRAVAGHTARGSSSSERRLIRNGCRAGPRSHEDVNSSSFRRRTHSSQDLRSIRRPMKLRVASGDVSDSSCSSMLSSPVSSMCDTNNENDNDSMVMMMTTTNDENDDPQHHHHHCHDSQRHLSHQRNQYLATSKTRPGASGGPAAHLAFGSTPTPEGGGGVRSLHKNETGLLAPLRSFRTASVQSLVPLTIIGLLLILVVVVFVMNALILRRLGQLESTIQIMAASGGCENGTSTRIGRRLSGADTT
uniref:GRAM domain-containing protein 1A n=1 Tax=Aceria tosichella TaxID=561515 RepID=A0A6G1SNR5_9ACAR